MTMAERRRLEELFSAEMILTRVCLHIMQRETTDIAAQMLAVMRLQEIQDEGTRLRRKVVLQKREKARQTGSHRSRSRPSPSSVKGVLRQ